MAECSKDECEKAWKKDDDIVSGDIRVLAERIEGMKTAILLKAKETEFRTLAGMTIIGIILIIIQVLMRIK